MEASLNVTFGTMLFIMLLSSITAIEVNAKLSQHNQKTFLGHMSGIHNASKLSPDEAAEDTFVRKCTVSLSAVDKSMMPINALERICDETDAVKECQLAVVHEAKFAQSSGASIQQLCRITYGWFQKKYGMYCPLQCLKFQCQSTCRWLDQKKGLDAEGEMLKDKLEGVKKDEADVKRAEESLRASQEEMMSLTDSIAHYNVVVNRSKAAYAEAQANFGFQQSRLMTFDGEVSKYEAAVANISESLRVEQATLQAEKMTIDIWKLKQSSAARALESAKKKLEKESAELAAEKEKAQKEQDNIGELLKKIATAYAKITELKSSLQLKAQALTKATSKKEAAEKKLANAVASKELPEVIMNYERNLDEMKLRLKEAQLQHDKVARELEKESLDLGFLLREKSTLETDLATTQAEGNGTLQEVKQLNATLTNLSASADAVAEELGKRSANASSIALAIGQKQKELKKMELTLHLTRQAQAQQSLAVKEAKKKEDTASMKLALAEGTLTSARERLMTVVESSQAFEASAKGLRSQWNGIFANATQKVEEHAKLQKELATKTPAIIVQHGLAFITFLGNV